MRGRWHALGIAAIAALALDCGGSVWAPPPAGSPIPPPGEGMDAGDELAMLAGEEPEVESASPKGPSSVSGQVPTLDTALAIRETCDKPLCGDPKVFAALGRTKSPVGVWTQDFAKAGNTLTFKRNKRVDVYGIVLSGSVQIGESRGRGKSVTAGEWTAFHAAGAGVKISAKKAAAKATPAARLVLAVVAEGTPIGEALKGFKSPKDRWQKRPSPLATVDLRKSADLAWANNSTHARIGFEGAGHRAAVSVLIASPDAVVPRHKHPNSWELIALLKGGGTLKKGKKPGDTELTSKTLSAGKIVAIGKGIDHAFSASGKEPTVAIQFYAPPGPEQRFKELAKGK